MGLCRYFNVPVKITLLLHILSLYPCEIEIDCNFTRIWGPGLDPENIIMPARYFFIETAGSNNIR